MNKTKHLVLKTQKRLGKRSVQGAKKNMKKTQIIESKTERGDQTIVASVTNTP